jgi:hypothetical protein
MEASPQGPEAQRGFGEADKLLKSAQSLGANIRAYAKLLAEDSVAALRAIESPFADYELVEDYWPLAGSFALEQALSEKVKRGVAYPEGFPTAEMDEESRFLGDASLDDAKYRNEDLEEIYDDDTPRVSLAHDLVRWASDMAAAGWPVLVHLDLRGEHRVEVSVYKETEEVRGFFDRSLIQKGDNPVECSQWLSSQVIVDCDAEAISRLTHQTST